MPTIESMFRVDEQIQIAGQPFRYLVMRTPATCIYNDKPAYLLKCLHPLIETPPFYRDQVDIETNWKAYEKP